MTKPYALEKWVWTDSDFERMGWHDARVYAFALLHESSELALDIDYIFEWVKPDEPRVQFTFWVAPCTLVFENVTDIAIDLAPYSELSIDNVSRTEPGVARNAQYTGRTTNWMWTLECQGGTICFRATGYTQYVRKAPHHGAQIVSMEIRGGVSFQRESARADDRAV